MTHRLSKSPTYKSWLKMRERCNDPSNNRYKSHGARGISVCDRWQQFENFYADMGERPKGYSIDRINNDGNYEPTNCKWSSSRDQANNRRSNRHFTINDETRTFAQWCAYLNLNPSTVGSRFYVYNWSIERSLELS